MSDKGPIKIICRVINLIIYVLVTFFIVLAAYTEIYKDIDFITEFYSEPFKVLLVCVIPLIMMMIIAIVIKYKKENDSKVNAYRIFETLVRIVCTIPISISTAYYIIEYTQFEPLINTLMTIAIFYILNGLMKFTLQETLSVGFIIRDEL